MKRVPNSSTIAQQGMSQDVIYDLGLTYLK